jgi:hypothetical protein
MQPGNASENLNTLRDGTAHSTAPEQVNLTEHIRGTFSNLAKIAASGRSGGRRRRAAYRQACREARAKMRSQGGRARRSPRRGAQARVRRPFASRRSRQLGSDRGGACAKAPRARQRRNDEAIPEKARPIPRQSDQGGGIVGVGKVFDLNGENELILNS